MSKSKDYLTRIVVLRYRNVAIVLLVVRQNVMVVVTSFVAAKKWAVKADLVALQVKNAGQSCC